MKRRIISFILCLAMLLSLVPISIVATAEETPVEGTTYEGMVSANGLELAKRVTDNKDGTYKVQLEAYATGEVVTTTTIVERAIPTDIVLVLDVSGSMNYRFGDNLGRYKDIKSSLDTTLGQIEGYYGFDFKTSGGKMYTPLRYNAQTSKWQYGKWSYWYDDWLWYDISDNEAKQVGISRIGALKAAVNSFIDSVKAKAEEDEENEVDHRIAIVTFADNASGRAPLTNVASNVDYLKGIVNGLTASGATAADYGMQRANTIISGIPADRESNKAVIMFTDGSPNHSSGFSETVANNTIVASKSIKSKSASVYTIGIFDGANPSTPIDSASDTNKYMHFVSSNYPNATSMTNYGARVDENLNFYLAADNASALSDVFQTISETIDNHSVTTSVELGSETVVHDIVADNFALPEGADENSIAVYTVAKVAGEGNWAEPVAFVATKTVVGKSVKVSGFNFKDNCVTEEPKPETTDDYGKNLLLSLQ
ncbi:MAG: VWA domain-containing protein [Ruminococcaceae bacterium]|nr:VWA domain-containing protein [Oscillospiraceae bacterium]